MPVIAVLACFAFCGVMFIVMAMFLFGYNPFASKLPPKKVDSGSYYNIYKTRDGKYYFMFRYILLPRRNTWDIDIMSMPSYGSRDKSYTTTHRLDSHRPDCAYKICVYADKAPKDLQSAMKLSMDWAELTYHYIKTGITIDDQIYRRERRR